MYKIEKHVPAPEDLGGMKKYPFDDMEIGDSFFVPNGKVRNIKQQVQYYQNKTEKRKRFAVREVEGGVRVWRVEPKIE